MDLVAALTLGFLGSLHCIGMCGPLTLAVPSSASSRWKFFLERLVFTAGRVTTYAVLGALLGMFGSKLFLAGVQQNISVILGITILVTIVLPLSLKSRLQKFSPLEKIYAVIKRRFSSLMKRRGSIALFLMGMMNGLLPCGLVYTALLGATAVADPGRSALFMSLFGVGTAPALIAVSLAGKLISLKFRPLFSRVVPFLSIALAIILILRGMNLGIPLVSPKVSQTVVTTPVHEETHTKMDCCE